MRQVGWLSVLFLCSLFTNMVEVLAYPTDEESYKRTHIRRLFWQQQVNEGKRRGRKMPEGARWPTKDITLKMLEAGNDFALTKETAKDPVLQKGLEAILKKMLWKNYNVALLDITNPVEPKYASVNENEEQTPGSVAKILVAAGLLQKLKERFPNDIAKREALLKETMVTADHWAMPNHHEVPKVTGDELQKISISKVRKGDTFSLWEWMDHTLSPSSNAAASILWREATLMDLLGEAYPPKAWDQALYNRFTKDQWTESAFYVVDRPLQDAGLDLDDFHLRMFFTHKANKYIRVSSSRATPLALIQWLLAVEQGKMVDGWSSLELKRMLYITRRRVRYLYGPELNHCAALFKSGSLYKCKPEPGFKCIQYQGNVLNVLNALVEIETPHVENPCEEPPTNEADAKAGGESATKKETDGAKDTASTDSAGADETNQSCNKPHAYTYMIAVMSNELKKNAAEDHAQLAKEVHALITASHKNR